MVSNIGKNVFKSVESSVHRIGASLPTRMDDEDLLSFATLAAELCEKCQVSFFLFFCFFQFFSCQDIMPLDE